jgi:hypothetical protein
VYFEEEASTCADEVVETAGGVGEFETAGGVREYEDVGLVMHDVVSIDIVVMMMMGNDFV